MVHILGTEKSPESACHPARYECSLNRFEYNFCLGITQWAFFFGIGSKFSHTPKVFHIKSALKCVSGHSILSGTDNLLSCVNSQRQSDILLHSPIEGCSLCFCSICQLIVFTSKMPFLDHPYKKGSAVVDNAYRMLNQIMEIFHLLGDGRGRTTGQKISAHSCL